MTMDYIETINGYKIYHDSISDYYAYENPNSPGNYGCPSLTLSVTEACVRALPPIGNNSITTDKIVYSSGETAQIHACSTIQCYLYIYYPDNTLAGRNPTPIQSGACMNDSVVVTKSGLWSAQLRDESTNTTIVVTTFNVLCPTNLSSITNIPM